MKITIEAEGHRLELDETMFEDISLSIPSDVISTETADGGEILRELGRSHIALVGLFKEGVRPEWKETTSG